MRLLHPALMQNVSVNIQSIYRIFNCSFVVLLLQKAFDNNTLKYAQFNINGTISDFEFFDQVELALLVQTDQGINKCYPFN